MFSLKRGKAGKRDFCEFTAQLFGVHINFYIKKAPELIPSTFIFIPRLNYRG